MRTLTTNTSNTKESLSSSPRYILKVEFGGAVGTKWYSAEDVGSGDASSALNAEGRVLAWGAVDAPVGQGDKATAVSDISLTLHDEDKVLQGYHDSVEWYGVRATLYIWFAGLPESDIAPVLSGIVNEPVTWDWTKGTVSLDITSIETKYRKTIGHVADRETFPSVSREDEGRAIPLVFGRCRYVPCLSAVSSLATRLVRPCGVSDDTLFVEDAQDFPQGEAVSIYVEKELITGQFDGNVFHVTQRGEVIKTSTTTADPTWPWELIDDTLGGTLEDWAGYNIEVHDPGGLVHSNSEIFAWFPTEHKVQYIGIIMYQGGAWRIPSGTAYRIISRPSAHSAGAPVTLKQPAYIYLVNDAPSVRVRAVVAYGTILGERWVQDLAGTRTRLEYEIDSYIPISPDLYTVNKNDTTSFPDLDHAVTTVTFQRPVTQFVGRLRDERLWADVDGVDQAHTGSGDLLENPADILLAILRRWLGLTTADYEYATFASAKATLAYLQMGFYLDRQWDSLELLASLAFQARCALLFDDGVARLKVLSNIIETSVATIDEHKTDLAAVESLRTKRDEIVSQVNGAYRYLDKPAQVSVTDTTVAAWCDRKLDVDLFAYGNRANALSIANFWLIRRKRVYELCKLRVFLRGLELQRLDTIALSLPDFWPDGRRALVTDIRHDLGDANADRMTEIELTGRLMTESECEAAESGEAQDCWTCETSCQFACELFCTSAFEILCQSGDAGCTGGLDTGVCWSCDASCAARCEGQCESGCEVICDSSCLGGTETGFCSCEIACTVGCTTAETGCGFYETGCQPSAETGCSSCEPSAETGCGQCESSVESGCGSCETGGETGCSYLETSCGDCETGAESGCGLVETGCAGCETSVESGCGSCETTEETGCVWEETGGPSSCCITWDIPYSWTLPEGIVCPDDCPSHITLDCHRLGVCQDYEGVCRYVYNGTCYQYGPTQIQCFYSFASDNCTCNVGCETSCESGCETTCESGCETSCETAGEVSTTCCNVPGGPADPCPGGVGDCTLTSADFCSPPCDPGEGLCYYSAPTCVEGVCLWTHLDLDTCVVP